MSDIKSTIQDAVLLLKQHSDSAQRDAEILLCHLLHKTRAFLYAYPEMALNQQQITTYQELISKRLSGIPIAYITKKRDFWSLSLQVSEHTLIPRPETELLVTKTLSLIDSSLNATILELGTGSGAIALSLATERPNWHIIAVDNSHEALSIAQQNAATLQLTNIEFILSDWFMMLEHQTFHAIVSNPPYIAADDPHLTQGDIRFEPKNALVSGRNGLESLHYIIKHSYNHLLRNGFLLLEHGYQQGKNVTQIFHDYGYLEVQCFQDDEGRDRVSCGKRN